MKIKNIDVSIVKEDIITFSKIQNKVLIDDVSINENIEFKGKTKVIGRDIDFTLALKIVDVMKDKIYIEIAEFRVLNFSLLSGIAKKIIEHLVGAFEILDGITFSDNRFRIEAFKLIKSYCTEVDIEILEEAEIKKLEVNKGKIDINFGGICINVK